MTYDILDFTGFSPQEVAAKDAERAKQCLAMVNAYNEVGNTAKATEAMDAYLFFIDSANTEPAI